MLRLISSLAVIAVAISPLAAAKERVAALFSDFERYVSSFAANAPDDALGESAGRAFSEEIAALVCREFELSSERVRVAVTVDTSGELPALTHVRVSVVADGAAPDPAEIASFVEGQTKTECEAVILAPG